MKPVFQRVFGNPSEGDCYPAAIASVLECELRGVPRVTLIDDPGMLQWLDERGLAFEVHWFKDLKPELFENAPPFFIAFVLSQVRLPGMGFTHAVVGRWDGEKLLVAHNPNPNAEPYPPNQAIGVGFILNKV